MTEPITPADSAEFIAFEEFRNGLPHGRFRVVVNRELAHRFVAQRLHATPVAIAIIGAGIASALAGYAIVGVLLVMAGLLFRRGVRWKAGTILLHLVCRQPAAYYDATASGVMEVQRA